MKKITIGIVAAMMLAGTMNTNAQGYGRYDRRDVPRQRGMRGEYHARRDYAMRDGRYRMDGPHCSRRVVVSRVYPAPPPPPRRREVYVVAPPPPPPPPPAPRRRYDRRAGNVAVAAAVGAVVGAIVVAATQ